MAKNYAMTAIRRSLVEAHSSVTPGQDAKRTQPGDSSEQGKSASKRLTSISDAHSQRGPCRQSLVRRPRDGQPPTPSIIITSLADARTSVPTDWMRLGFSTTH